MLAPLGSLLMNRIFEHRKKERLSQEALARLVGVSRNTMQRIESGSGTRMSTALAIARVLKTTVEELFPQKEEVA